VFGPDERRRTSCRSARSADKPPGFGSRGGDSKLHLERSHDAGKVEEVTLMASWSDLETEDPELTAFARSTLRCPSAQQTRDDLARWPAAERRDRSRIPARSEVARLHARRPNARRRPPRPPGWHRTRGSTNRMLPRSSDPDRNRHRSRRDSLNRRPPKRRPLYRRAGGPAWTSPTRRTADRSTYGSTWAEAPARWRMRS